MSEADPIPYCYVADKNYTNDLAISINCLVANFPPGSKPIINIVTDAESPIKRDQLMAQLIDPEFGSLIKCQEVALPDLVPQIKKTHVSKAAHLKFCLPELFHDQYKNIFYLDCDTAVFGDPANSPKMDKDSYLMACIDHWFPTWGAVYPEIESDFPGVDPNRPYFNAGVLFMNTRRLNDLGFKENCIEFHQRYSAKIAHQDQDVLNLACGNWSELPWEFNVQSGFLMSGPLWMRPAQYNAFKRLAYPKILHFVGHMKWGRGSILKLPVRLDMDSFRKPKLSIFRVFGYLVESLIFDFSSLSKRFRKFFWEK